MKFLTLLGVMVALCLYATAQSNAKAALTIGDHMPSLTLYNVINAPNKSLDLKQLKGKAMLIDFWSIGCLTCFESFPKLQQLQNEYGDQLKILLVSPDEKAEVQSLFTEKRYDRFLNNLKLPMIVEDSMLASLFPHETIPHIAWVGADGTIKAITRREYVTQKNVADFVAGKNIELPLKIDAVDFDDTQPLFSFSNNTTVEQPKKIFYSGFSSWIRGTGPGSGLVNDTASGTTRIFIINGSILRLYLEAYRQPDLHMTVDASQRNLIVKDSLRYFFPRSSEQIKAEWKEDNNYCYEAIWPLGTPIARIREKLKKDLDDYFDVTTEVKVTMLPSGKVQKIFILRENNTPQN
jgi:thiol-disulfide isomerase/thioredoxin